MKRRQKTSTSKAIVLLLAFLLAAVPLFADMGGAQAKEVGKKNKQVCDSCVMVRDGKAPSLADYSSKEAGTHTQSDQRSDLTYGSDGYSTDKVTYETVIDKAVYRGGNAKSGTQQHGGVDFDADPNDFASVLPYGNTYIDTGKLNWGQGNNFIIDIAPGAPFKWIAGRSYEGRTDAANHPVDVNPMGNGKYLQRRSDGNPIDLPPAIAYYGPIKGYLGDNPEDWRKKSQATPKGGQENIIKASDYGSSYLYRITYPGAATLKDGTKGDLVISVDRVEIETTASQDIALITLQSANQLNMGADLFYEGGYASKDYVNITDFVAKTAEDMQTYLAGTGLSGAGWIEDKGTRAATGAIIDLDVWVVDPKTGGPAKGSISYAARDMDLENYQSQWGRSIKGEDKYMFNEALTIESGSLSYAVTPYYDHAHETTRDKGWIPVRPGSSEVRTSPLHITKTGGGSHADGVRFSGIGNVMLRDKEESFANALAAYRQDDGGCEIRTALDGHTNNADTVSADPNSYTIRDNYKKQVAAKLGVSWETITNEQIFNYLGEGSYGDRRGDRDTFDTGFAVLMNAQGFSLQWSGSMQNQGSLTTTLFDDSIYTLVEQSHGVGGGTYLETYDIADDCKVNRAEGTVTMARGTDATVTVVPEDGHRVRTIMVGGEGLSSPKEYKVAELSFADGKYEDSNNGVTIEKNADGTYDVTLANVQDTHHVHADFTADYYFYKVWKDAAKDGMPPTTDLTLKATLFDASGAGQGTTKTFVVTKADADNTAETNITVSTEGDNIVWKIKYPAEGYTTKGGTVWPALGIEPEPSSHGANHDQVRYYWFVTEAVNGWKLVGYDNAAAKAPGVVDAAAAREETLEATGGDELNWATTAKKDYSTASSTITGKKDAAFLSVFADGGKIENEITPPVGTPKETWGAKNQAQTADGKSMFRVTTEKTTTGANNTIVKAELLDDEGNPATSVTVPEGTYTIDDSGKITFTPKTDFVGNPTPVKVRGTDGNGLTAETTYTPHIVDVEETVTRTITYEYSDGTPVKDSEGKPLTVVQTVAFTGTVNPDTGEIDWGDEKELAKVDSDPINGYTVDKESVPAVNVKATDDDLAVTVIYSPKGVTATPDETWGLQGQKQTGTPKFEMETKKMPDGSDNQLTVKLLDKDGNQTDTVKVPGQGTYKLNDDGTITFTPEDGYIGNPDPVEVIGTDRNSKTAKTTYTPHIVDPTDQGTAKRTVHFTYLTDDGKTVTEDVVQELTLTRHATKVDPKTGEVQEWGPWEKQTFPAVENPDDKLNNDGVSEFGDKTWSTDDSAGELEVTEPGDKGTVHIVYHKEPYTVIYHDGDHGKSDGKGDQKGEDYNNDVTGGNGVTPAKGYHFTGKYTYVIKDKNGNVIKEGETDDPKSVKITGNIEFTPLYAPNKYTIKYDPNGGSGTMTDQNFTGADESATSKENTFTRKGYTFTGFKAKLPDGTYLQDENGNDLVFATTEDFLEHLHEQGDGGEITLVAQWEKDMVKSGTTPKKGKTGRVKSGDGAGRFLWCCLLVAALATCAIGFDKRRRERG